MIERAIESVRDMLQLLISPKLNPDNKTNKGVFDTKISFTPSSECPPALCTPANTATC